MVNIKHFEDLEIWRLSLVITKLVYDLTSQKEFQYEYGLKNQIRNAVVSVSSNIVEGFEKNNNNEFRRFLKISKGSVGEIRNQLYICLKINYIRKNDFDLINMKLLELGGRIGKLIKYLESKKPATRHS